MLMCAGEGEWCSVPGGCRIRVFKCPAAAPFGKETSDKIKPSLLLHDYVITPATAVNVEKIKRNHGKVKLVVTFRVNEDDFLGTSGYEELVFKDQSKATTSHVAELESFLFQGPYEDMRQFNVEISPHQIIPEGPARFNIFRTHISVVKRFTTERQKENSMERVLKTVRKGKVQRLPLVVRLANLRSYSSLPVGFRFDTKQRKTYFFKCCSCKDGEDMNAQIKLAMGSQPSIRSVPPKRLNPPKPPPDKPGPTEPTYVNEWEARRCEEDIHGGIKLNVGVFAAKPQPGQPWVLYVCIGRQGASLQDVKQCFPGREMVCPSRVFQVVSDLSINTELPDGWSTDNVVKEVPKDQFSALEDPFIHEICIQHRNHGKKQFHGRIYIRQGLSVTLRITLNVITNFTLYERVGRKRNEPLYDLVPRDRPVSSGDSSPTWLRLFSERKKLWDSLDIPNLFGDDWRLFAEKIGLDYQAIVTIENHSHSHGTSPTELVLSEWERGRTAVPVSDQALVQILHDMGRPDVIQDMALQVPELEEFRVEATTPNTMQVTWAPAMNDITHYVIEIKPPGCALWSSHHRQGNCRSLVFRDLRPDTEYELRIQPSIQRVNGEWINITAKTDVACTEL
ncbi:uncharacterized protein LOC144915363 [Branchiostoma floridae x Branchiostoma belcheri]